MHEVAKWVNGPGAKNIILCALLARSFQRPNLVTLSVSSAGKCTERRKRIKIWIDFVTKERDGGRRTGRSGGQRPQMPARFETKIGPLRHSMVWYPELGIHQWLPTFVCMCVLVKGRGQQGGYTPELRPSSLLGRLVALIQICP